MMIPASICDACVSEGYVDHAHLARVTGTEYKFTSALEGLLKGLYSRGLYDDLSVLSMIGENETDSLMNIVDATNDLVHQDAGVQDWLANRGFGGTSLGGDGAIGTTKLTKNMSPDLIGDYNAGVYFETAVSCWSAISLYISWQEAGVSKRSGVLISANGVAQYLYGDGQYSPTPIGTEMEGQKGQLSLRYKTSIGTTAYLNMNGVASTDDLTVTGAPNNNDTNYWFVGYSIDQVSWDRGPDAYRASAFWLGAYIDTDTYDNDFYPLILAYLQAVGAD